MAKKTTTLSFRDIVLGAEADIIRQALEARVQIDQLVQERQLAYERIAALETQVEDALGETGVFPFPAPPLVVAGFDPKAETVTRTTGIPKKPATARGVISAAAIPNAGTADAEDETPADQGEDSES